MMLISLVLLLGACVPTKAPDNLNRAKKHAARHYEGLKNITRKHPGITDSTRRVIRDTLIIPSISGRATGIARIDTARFNSLLLSNFELMSKYAKLSKEVKPERYGAAGADLLRQVKELERELEASREQLLQSASEGVADFTFDDNNIYFERKIIDGKWRNTYRIKQRAEAYDKTVVSVGLDVKRQTFWQRLFSSMGQILFWIILIIACTLILFTILKYKSK